MKIFNAQPVMPVVVFYEKDDKQAQTVVYVNYGQDEVYFLDNPELNNDENRRAILGLLDSPHFLEQDGISAELWEEIEQVREGNYGPDIDELQKETEEDGNE